MADTTPRFVEVADVATLVRKSLKKHFPDVKFSVRSNRYAGGASVVVRWKGGPQESEVMAKVNQYAGSRLDGDYSPRPVYHYLRPDGEAMVAYNPASWAVGASDSEGEDNREMARLMPTGVELVHFCADFVMCYREPSDAEAVEMQRQSDEARAGRDPDELPF
jgi:hypothetical protein